MSRVSRSDNEFVGYDAIMALIPVSIGYTRLLRLSHPNVGAFPPCVRTSRKAPPLWNKDQVRDWTLSKFADVLSPERLREVAARFAEK